MLLTEIAQRFETEVRPIISGFWSVSGTGREGLESILLVMCTEAARTEILAKYGPMYEGEEIHFQILDHPASFADSAA